SRIRASDVVRILMRVDYGNRRAERGPDTVVVDPSGHHIDQHLVVADAPGRHDFESHRCRGRTMSVLADRPGVHLGWYMAERRDFPDGVKILRDGSGLQLGGGRHIRASGQVRDAQPQKPAPGAYYVASQYISR